jgi:hypothetical protein
MSEPVYSIEDYGNTIRITIRCRKHWPTIIWSVACIAVTLPFAWLLPTIRTSSSLELLLIFVTTVLMLAGFILGCLVLAWQLDGKEVLTIDPKMLEIRRTSFGFKNERVIHLESVKSLKAMPKEHDLGFRWSYLRPCSVFVYNSGKIAIEQEKRIYRVGSGLRFDEAEEIVRRIQNKNFGVGVM